MEILEQKEKGKTQFLLLDAVLLSAMRPGVGASINNYDLRVDLLFFSYLGGQDLFDFRRRGPIEKGAVIFFFQAFRRVL